jgi:hypothetical protein
MTDAERIKALQALGYNKREAAFLCLAAPHSGYFLRRQEGVKKSGYSQLRLAAGADSTTVLAVRLWQSPIFSHLPVPDLNDLPNERDFH